MYLRFADYTRFTPDTGSPDNILVTLAKIDWKPDSTTSVTNGDYVHTVSGNGHKHADPQSVPGSP
jgi:hypothetical protein